jgi:hypothetical protein
MPLYRITAKKSSRSNGIEIPQGLTLDVVSKYTSNPFMVNGGKEVEEAFQRQYGIDLRKFGGGGISNTAHMFDVKKIGN